jgi:hypothetical protein
MELVVLGTAAAPPFLALVHLLPFFLPCCLGVHDDGALQEPPEDVETANETEEKTEEEVPEAEGESEQAGRLIAKRRQGVLLCVRRGDREDGWVVTSLPLMGRRPRTSRRALPGYYMEEEAAHRTTHSFGLLR